MIQQINSLISKGELEEALVTVDQAIDANGHLSLYHEKKAEILSALGDKRGEIKSIRQAIKWNPGSDYLRAKLIRLVNPLPVQLVEGGKWSTFAGIHDRAPILSQERFAEGGYRMCAIQKVDSSDHPLVSVVTAVYNNPDTLERCIQSVADQDYPNIEHIIVDGGSSRPTIEILEKHQDTIAYYVSEKDGGIYSAMNKGIELSKGTYICLLNSDDTYDSQFVSKCLAIAKSKDSKIVFTSYFHGDNLVKSPGVNPGILLSHLNICHGTFLVHRNCYNQIGRYSEKHRIISDVLWMIKAYKAGVKFDQLPEPLFRFAVEGLSSGTNQAHRDLLISEICESYLLQFPFLSPEEAKTLYLLRFSPRRLSEVIDSLQPYFEDSIFRTSVACYVRHCIEDRDNFIIKEGQLQTLFSTYTKVCEALSLPFTSIRIDAGQWKFSELIHAIDRAGKLKKTRKANTLLHFATVFSASSETFIYDLVTTLENSTNFDNFFLHDKLELDEDRPYSKRIFIPWDILPKIVRDFLYLHIFSILSPDLIIGHFALNTWKLNQRLVPLKIKVPMLSMTHGIDVSMIKNPGPYRDFVITNLSRRDDCHFTTVSNFLRQELITSGVPSQKIDLIYNTINPRFQDHRRLIGPLESNEPIKILAVGRLIGLKGHRFLIEALRIFKNQNLRPFTLTLVFANGAELLKEITDQIQSSGLLEEVSLIPFVNFNEDPDFYARHDLFIHPSTFSEGQTGRTESFGMSVLEAIAAGLTVITTNVGGIPEVIGNNPGKFAKLVQHGNAESLAEAIYEVASDSDSFQDNWEYATKRLELFSKKTQLEALAKAIFKISPINASLFSSSTLQGAGYAAFRLHRGLRAQRGVESILHTTVSHHRHEPGVKVIPHPSGRSERWGALQKASHSKQNLTIFTVNVPTVLNATLSRLTERADIINLHWTARFLSVENIAHLTHGDKPVVITVRDMLPITGGCHFFHGCDGWKHNCEDCPQLVDHWENFPARVLEAKRKRYHFPNLTLVALSKNSEAILRQSPYFKGCRIEVIPNSIETEVFRPQDKEASRLRLGLPLDRKIIAYVPSYSSKVKGYKEATQALEEMSRNRSDLNPFMLLVGRKTPATDSITLDMSSVGYVHDNEELSYIYSAADLVIVPSLEETFSNTTAEALSCGTPVVGFKTGAIPDMVIDGVTGYTFEVGDIEGFARGIISVLTGPNMSEACRELALRELQFDIQARRYKQLFSELVAFARPPEGTATLGQDRFSETTSTVTTLLTRAFAQRKS